MTSKDAADWLIEHFPRRNPDCGRALQAISHRSWLPRDQIRLAEHYLSRLPFASEKPYEVFASFMKVTTLLDILRKNLPSEDGGRRLFEYHVRPVLLRTAKTPKDRDAVTRFLYELKPL